MCSTNISLTHPHHLSLLTTGDIVVDGSSQFSGNLALNSAADILNIVPGKFQLGEQDWVGQTVSYSAPASTTIKSEDEPSKK